MTRQPDTLGTRLKMARKRAKLTQIQLAERAGMKQPDISKIELGDIQKTTGIARLAQACQVEPEWLELGNGPMVATPSFTTAAERSTPYVNSPSAPSVIDDQAHAVSELKPIVRATLMVWEDLVLEKIKGQFLMAVQGEALMPTFPPGQMAIWEAGDFANPGQAVLLHMPDGSFKVRFYEVRGTSWAGISERKGFGELLPEKDGAQIVARLRFPDYG